MAQVTKIMKTSPNFYLPQNESNLLIYSICLPATYPVLAVGDTVQPWDKFQLRCQILLGVVSVVADANRHWVTCSPSRQGRQGRVQRRRRAIYIAF